MQRHSITLGPKEIAVIDEIQRTKPEWNFFNTSEKAKELFWRGAKQLLEGKTLYNSAFLGDNTQFSTIFG